MIVRTSSYVRLLPVLLSSLLWLWPASARAQTIPREMTLDEAIQLSLDRSPATVAADGAVQNARAARLQSRGSWIPNLTVNSSYSNSSNERFDQATGRLLSESYTAQVNGSVEVFTGGRRLAQWLSADASLAAAEADEQASRFQTRLTTTRVFYATAAAADLLTAAEARLDRARQQLAFAQTRLEVGTATNSDILRARIEEGNARLAVLDAQTSLDQSALQLGRQVGLDGRVQPVSASLPDRAPPLPPVETIVERALSTSPVVLSAQARLQSSHADRLAAYTPYLPSLRLTGGYDWFAFGWPPNQQSWSVRLIGSLPIFNGFSREASLKRAVAAEETDRARERDARIAARGAAESAVKAITAANERVTLSDESIELAREDLRVQEERYKLGASTILDLQTSQIALTEAEAAAIRARQALGTAIAQLEAVLGVRIDSEGIQWGLER